MRIEKEHLHLLAIGTKIYNDQRLARDFQKDEIYKFLDWFCEVWGYPKFNYKAEDE